MQDQPSSLVSPLRLGSRRRARRQSGSPLRLRPSRPLLHLRCPSPPPFRCISILAPVLLCPCWPAAAVRRSSAGSHGAPGWRRLVVTSDLPVVWFNSCTATFTASPPVARVSAVFVYMEPICPGSPGPALLGTPPTTTSHLTSSTSGGKEVKPAAQLAHRPRQAPAHRARPRAPQHRPRLRTGRGTLPDGRSPRLWGHAQQAHPARCPHLRRRRWQCPAQS